MDYKDVKTGMVVKLNNNWPSNNLRQDTNYQVINTTSYKADFLLKSLDPKQPIKNGNGSEGPDTHVVGACYFELVSDTKRGQKPTRNYKFKVGDIIQLKEETYDSRWKDYNVKTKTSYKIYKIENGSDPVVWFKAANEAEEQDKITYVKNSSEKNVYAVYARQIELDTDSFKDDLERLFG